MMQELHGIGNNLNQIAAKARLNALDVHMTRTVAKLDETSKAITAVNILPPMLMTLMATSIWQVKLARQGGDLAENPEKTANLKILRRPN